MILSLPKLHKKVNEPNAIDEMVAEARLEYALGKAKTFSSAKGLMKDLYSHIPHQHRQWSI